MVKEFTFRQSDLEQFGFCLERGRAYYESEAESVPTEAALHGTAVHAAIAWSLEHKLLGAPSPVVDMMNVYDETFEEGEVPDLKWVRHKKDKLREYAWHAIRGWKSEVAPLVEPELIEHKFENVLLTENDDYRILLEGQPDCLDQDGQLWDWKTSTRPYVEWEKQRWAIQPTVYAFAMEELGEVSWPVTFRYAVMIHGKEIQLLNVQRTSEHAEWLKYKLLTLAKTLDSGQKPLPLSDEGWWCSADWCGNWDQCKGAHHGGDDWKTVVKL